MSLVRARDTKPELLVRRIVHSMGYRFRLHRRDLPGTPDLVFPRLRKVIFVHGCFWHQHSCAAGARMPKSRIAFWQPKLLQNVARDHKAVSRLRRDGWGVLIVWECQTKDIDKLRPRLDAFLARCRHSSSRRTALQHVERRFTKPAFGKTADV